MSPVKNIKKPKTASPARSLVRVAGRPRSSATGRFTKASSPERPSQKQKQSRRNHVQAPKEFHLFPKLPAELQLLVWKAWREDQPVIRHYFSLEAGGRVYAASDLETPGLITTAARSAEPGSNDPIDPEEYKIRFTNGVTTIGGTDTVARLTKVLNAGNAYGKGSLVKPAYTWVNFEKDIFIINNTTYNYGGRLRFLLRGIGAKFPAELSSNHWATRIQKLALRVQDAWQRAREPCGRIDELDGKIISKMKALKTIYIITARNPHERPVDWSYDSRPMGVLPPATRLVGNDHPPGFTDPQAHCDELHRSRHRNMGTSHQSCRKCCGVLTDVSQEVEQIKAMLQSLGRNKVKVVGVADLHYW